MKKFKKTKMFKVLLVIVGLIVAKKFMQRKNDTEAAEENAEAASRSVGANVSSIAARGGAGGTLSGSRAFTPKPAAQATLTSAPKAIIGKLQKPVVKAANLGTKVVGKGMQMTSTVAKPIVKAIPTASPNQVISEPKIPNVKPITPVQIAKPKTNALRPNAEPDLK